MRATLLVALAVAVPARADENGTAAVYWQPPGHTQRGADGRAAFAAATSALGLTLVDAPAPVVPPPPSLLPLLEAARADYAAFRFRESLGRLYELQRLAEAAGGGELDTRQLAEIFLYRGLCRIETGAEAEAWDDLVRAARLDPGRVIDPAHVPPRAAATYKRAAQEVVQLPHTELRFDVPGDARVRVDGADVSGPLSLLLGPHFVTIAADGFRPWGGLVEVAADKSRLAPSLRPYVPPAADELVATVGGGRTRLVIGAAERTAGGWRLAVQVANLRDGKSAGDAVGMTDAPLRAPVELLVRRLAMTNLPLVPTAAASVAVAPTPPRPARRWWPWVAGAGAATVVIVTAVTLGVVLGRSTPTGTVSGHLGL